MPMPHSFRGGSQRVNGGDFVFVVDEFVPRGQSTRPTCGQCATVLTAVRDAAPCWCGELRSSLAFSPRGGLLELRRSGRSSPSTPWAGGGSPRRETEGVGGDGDPEGGGLGQELGFHLGARPSLSLDGAPVRNNLSSLQPAASDPSLRGASEG